MAVFQIEQAHLPAVFVIELHNLRHRSAHLLQQGLILDDRGQTVIAQELAAVYGQNLNFGIGSQLIEYVLERAAAEVKLISVQQMEAKRWKPKGRPLGWFPSVVRK